MNSLEKIAIKKLKDCLYSAQDRCSDENKDRIQHEQMFILKDIKDALEVVKAIEENNEKQH